MKLREMAERLGCEFTGDAETEIRGVAPIETAGPGELTFLANPRYRRYLRSSRAGAVVVARDMDELPLPTLRSGNPYYTFARAIELFHAALPFPPGVHPTAVISPRARIGPEASIGPYCFVDDEVEIGARCRLHSFVAIYRGAKIGDDFTAHSHAVVREQVRIGDRVILQNGAVVGADGFGFARQDDGHYYKIRPAGLTIIEDDVEIQANSCIDRPTVGETRIRRGVKIDNLVQVGHSCTVGEDSLLCAQVGLAGSTHVGKDVILGGQVGVAGHCHIGDGVRAIAQSGIPSDVEAGQHISGSPAVDARLWMKCSALYARLPEMHEELRALRKEVEALKKG
ncbi:MAG TPA: UDP-3-O-(3-hydroxymyristoyl)glucosamine N-acyltransferase [Candidatus Xenobia bacterium]|nr:UDP-3-O-(3-hydroxymyristoyl)glucosamine N-acyltransferase [Candidatus Xenobia bacterium]